LAVARNSVRIIGGRWRGRRLRFPERPGLRPTPDRVRETLFNWLSARLPEARVLDLFAGSGALGFEAASRGAREVALVERERAVAGALRVQAEALGAGNVRVVCADALDFLRAVPAAHDIVFVDAPYRYARHGEICGRLEAGWLAAGAFVYLETASGDPPVRVPGAWALHRETRAGEVAARLYQVRGGEARDVGRSQAT
jgi:16S rRNA (guanine966-N2)-methyltransferase